MIQPVVVVSIDGVAPRFITPETMPALCSLAQQGASCFDARTVVPSITLPAHASLLRGIDPSVHGIVDNTPQPLSDEWPTFLKAARDNGHPTAAAVNWAPVAGLLESNAVDARYYLDGGYGLDDDRRIRHAASSLFSADAPAVMFVYFVAPDLAGHDHGWGSDPYLDALRASDQHLAVLVDTIGDAAILVTTDHGGHGNDHQQSEPIDQVTFVTLRADDIEPATSWAQASILDIAPTVAELLGFSPAPTWSGTSLVGRERPTVDFLLDEVQSLAQHTYGEDLSMLAHSLQTAEQVRRLGGSEQLVLAGLLHDVGHLTEDAGQWGDPDHANAGAVRLQQLLPQGVVEPVRLHVAAKRWLVANDPTYHAQLSEASQETLRQQGGAFDAVASAEFLATPWSGEAIMLRRGDDLAKDPAAPTPGLATYRTSLEHALSSAVRAGAALRNRCDCEQCRDAVSGQSLLDVTDLDNWRATRTAATPVMRNTKTGEEHVIVDRSRTPESTAASLVQLWSAGRTEMIAARRSFERTHEIARDVAAFGLSIVEGVPTTPGAVLAFARTLGHVRVTNYGELFDVRNKPAATNLAYTTRQLPLHTDNPYRDPVPTVQVLHCIKSAAPDGGSWFSDGFAAAERLRAARPDAFQTLTSRLLTFRYADDTVDLVAQYPMIELDATDNVRAIHVNHRSMVPLDPGPAAEKFYAAYADFQRECMASATLIDTVLEAGEAAIFDNRRVLHARGPYDPMQPRHLQGCYIDIDALHSAARRHPL